MPRLAISSLALVTVLLFGCGSDGDGTGGSTTGDPSGGDPSGGDPSGGDPSGGDPTSPTPTAPDLKANVSVDFRGTFSVRGTITIPAAAPGKTVLLHVLSGSVGATKVGGQMPAGTTATYEITGLSAKDYKIRAVVDANGEFGVNPGDYSGWARGTTAAPIMTDGDADAISVAASVKDVDFGLGIE